MLERNLFNADHEAFRDSFRRFMDKEIAPFHAAWEDQGYVDREVWRKAGANGFLCMTMPEQYGGAGVDKLYSVVQMEELSGAGFSGIGYGLHTEIIAPYLLHYGTEAQKQKYLPKMATGEMVGAIAMSEPAAGSDLQGVKSTAVRQGDHYVLNGSKTFITNGWHADLVIVVAKTNPAAGAKGTSLLLVERGMPGFETGKRLKKVGLKAQDTAELFFSDVKVPVGEPARRCAAGEPRLHLPDGAAALGAAADRHRRGGQRAGVDRRHRWPTSRSARSSASAVAAATRTPATSWPRCRPRCTSRRVFVDQCTELLLAGKLDTATASMAKYWCSDLQCKVVDECVQLHGGYGYMWEYPIARAYADARVQRIYGGTNEIMKEVISRSMGLGGR